MGRKTRRAVGRRGFSTAQLRKWLLCSSDCMAAAFGLSVVLMAIALISGTPQRTSREQIAVEQTLVKKSRSCLAEAPGPCVMSEVQHLLKKRGVNPDTEQILQGESGTGYYLSHLAAASAEPVASKLLQELLDAGADVNLRAEQGLKPTPLYVAASHGQCAQAEILLRSGADVDAGDRLNTTPLYIAVQDGDLNMTRLLLAAGANVNQPTMEGWYAINVAVTERRDVLHGEKVCERDVGCGHLHPPKTGIQVYDTIVAELLSHGGDPSLAVTDDGFPALHNAIRNQAGEIVRMFLEHGSDTSETLKTGETALCIAAFYGLKDIVVTLLEHDADPLQTCIAQQTGRLRKRFMAYPAEMARFSGYPQISDILQAAMKEARAKLTIETETLVVKSGDRLEDHDGVAKLAVQRSEVAFPWGSSSTATTSELRKAIAAMKNEIAQASGDSSAVIKCQLLDGSSILMDLSQAEDVLKVTIEELRAQYGDSAALDDEQTPAGTKDYARHNRLEEQKKQTTKGNRQVRDAAKLLQKLQSAEGSFTIESDRMVDESIVSQVSQDMSEDMKLLVEALAALPDSIQSELMRLSKSLADVDDERLNDQFSDFMHQYIEKYQNAVTDNGHANFKFRTPADKNIANDKSISQGPDEHQAHTLTASSQNVNTYVDSSPETPLSPFNDQDTKHLDSAEQELQAMLHSLGAGLDSKMGLANNPPLSSARRRNGRNAERQVENSRSRAGLEEADERMKLLLHDL